MYLIFRDAKFKYQYNFFLLKYLLKIQLFLIVFWEKGRVWKLNLYDHIVKENVGQKNQKQKTKNH